MPPLHPLMLRADRGRCPRRGAWPLLRDVLPSCLRSSGFLLAYAIFTLGPGMVVGWRLTRDLDPFSRVVVLLGAGSAITALLIDVLGRVHFVAAFPYATSAMVGAGVALWTERRPPSASRIERADLWIAAALVTLAAGLGAIVFWHRLGSAGGGIQLFGDYDSADLGYYASEASEASHTVPPTAAYYSGHKLNAAYYPHLVLGMIHRFAGVPVLSMYYGLAWPTFGALIALTGYTLVRLLASRAVAALAVVLLLVCSDFSYLAAWFLPHAAVDWDYVLWPTNFLSPTMQVLHFATWAPSLPVFFTALFAIVRGLQTGRWGWLALGALLTGILFEFKPFIYLVLMAALSASAVFSGRDWITRKRFAVTVLLAVLCTVPSLIGAATLDPEDRRTRLLIEWFMLPKRMLIKLDLVEPFERAAQSLAPWPGVRDADPVGARHSDLLPRRRRYPMDWRARSVASRPRARRSRARGVAAARLGRHRRTRHSVCVAHRPLRRFAAVLSHRSVSDVDLHGVGAGGVRPAAPRAWSHRHRPRDPRHAAVLRPLSTAPLDRSDAQSAREPDAQRAVDRPAPPAVRSRNDRDPARPAAGAVTDDDRREPAHRARVGRPLLGRRRGSPPARRQYVLRVSGGRRRTRPSRFCAAITSPTSSSGCPTTACTQP